MTQYYFHFVNVSDDNVPRLRLGDNREVRVGETLTVNPPIKVCHRGLHACRRVISALLYIPERPRLCVVTLGGVIEIEIDKLAASERTVVAMLGEEETRQLLLDYMFEVTNFATQRWVMHGVTDRFLATRDLTLLAEVRSDLRTSYNIASGPMGASAWSIINHLCNAVDKIGDKHLYEGANFMIRHLVQGVSTVTRHCKRSWEMEYLLDEMALTRMLINE